jgi:anthranilate/para-aminobenzoate synthase component I
LRAGFGRCEFDPPDILSARKLNFALQDIHIRLDSSDSAAIWNLPPNLSAPTRILWLNPKSGLAQLADAGGASRSWSDPLAALDWMARSIRDEKNARWIGYLSYDIGRWFEQWDGKATDDLGIPQFVFTYHAATLTPSPGTPGEGWGEGLSNPPLSNFPRAAYESAIARVIEYIRAGDVFQVNLSQRFTALLPDSAARIYRRLPPARYGALLDYGHFALLCNSPELFFCITPDRRIITRPIKGTRPILPGMKGDLERSVKDRAELDMIVDLERNDLGRVCRIGSVNVTQRRVIETHPTVYQGVATIEGLLREEIGFVDLLRAIFPGGSVTGAPKIRAMQIIDELEPVRRGPYCGAIGYLDSDGTMEFNIAIRTMIAKGGRVHIPVGGGIVADSDPAQEYEETLVKAQAMFAALGVRNP